MLMLPSSVADFSHPELSRVIRATQVSPAMTGEERVKLMKLTWDAVGTEFASRHLQYEMFYAGGQYVTRAHSYRTYDWERATGMAKNVTSSYQLADFLGKGEQAA
jgi:4-hydroxyphenylacetate 3-monooxygenase